MKKVLSFLLIVTMLMAIGSNVFALENMEKEVASSYLPIHKEKVKSVTGQYKDDITIKTLTDFSGNKFELIETGASGYYIFDTSSGKYIEYSTDAPSPYLGKSGELKYFGPKSYYVDDNGSLSHTIISTEKNVNMEGLSNLQNSFDKMIKQSRETKDNKVLSLLGKTNLDKSTLTDAFDINATNSYISNSSYIRYASYPPNEDGTCGYVGACLVLNYWNKTNPGVGVIPSYYLDSNGNLLTSGYTLQDKLLSYGYGNSTWALDIRDVLIDFCNEYGTGAISSYYIGKIGAVSEIQNNRPVILFGSLPDVSSSGKVNHAVTAYGFRNETLVSYFIVHYGWSGYEHVVLDGGLIGSNTQFRLN